MVVSLRTLPAALLSIVLASLVFAAPTSQNDQFRAIAAFAPQKPEPPVCCLKLLQPLEEKEEEVLLSFEEWKSKQSLLEKTKGKDAENKSAHAKNGSAGGTGNGAENLTEAMDGSNAEEVHVHDESLKVNPTPEVEVLSPHFRVPLRGRFNYANSDCSARVHMSHRSAKSSSAILSSKRDRYMLSPCVSPNREPHFVVVELCDDIAIDTVQLANFEFFSGVFKDFKVSVTKTDFTKPAHEWTDAGTYRAKNVRGVQSFPLPKTLRDFYRYIRIDFISHYGSEYYCPVSLLRVYGLTHLEQYKWDEWAAQIHPETAQPILDSLPPPSKAISEEYSAQVPNTKSPEQVLAEEHSANSKRDVNSAKVMPQPPIASSTGEEPISGVPAATVMAASALSSAQPKDTPSLTGPQAATVDSTFSSTHKTPVSIPDPGVYTAETAAPSIPTIVTTPTSSAAATSSPSQDGSSLSVSSISTTSRGKAHTTSVISSTTTPIIVSAGASSIIHHTTGGESIYRTIMNRITALENNHTLYALYLGEQTDGVREKLRRLAEDVGRLEGIGRGQAQSYHRTLQQWENQQLQMQRDYRELLSKIEHLSGEIVLEKRLGIAQLCLLLAVLVFMGLTRGSRERVQVAPPSNPFIRKLKLSGDWAHNLVRRRTRSGDSAITDVSRSQRSSEDFDHPQRDAEQTEPRTIRGDPASPSSVTFPEQPLARRPLQTHDLNSRQEGHQHEHVSFPIHYGHSIKSRSRTPSRRFRGHTRESSTVYSQNQGPPFTPTHSLQHSTVYSAGYARPRMQRSNSHGAGASLNAITSTGHRTTKRWGRVAHLHDMRAGDIERRGRKKAAAAEKEQRDGTDTDEDVFGKKRSTLGLYEQKSHNHEERESTDLGASRLPNGQTSPVEGVSPVSPGRDAEDQWVDTDTDQEESNGEPWALDA